MEKGSIRRPGTAAAGILFSVTIFLFLMIGYRAQKSEIYSGLLITEFLIIMLPALLFLLFFRYDLRKVLRLNKTKAVNFLVIFCIMLFAMPLASIFNLLNLLIVNSVFGKIIVQQLPVADNAMGLLVNILVIAGAAGLCEEFLFRGVLQRSFERFGKARAILLAAFLFSLTHLDFQKIFGTFALGALIGFLVYRSDSLFCGMFAHFTNNAAAVVLTYASLKLQNMLGTKSAAISGQTNLSSLFSTMGSLPPEQLVIVAFVYGFLLLFVIALFVALIFAFIKLNPAGKADIGQASTVETAASGTAAGAGKATELLWLLPGVAFIAVMYFAEVMKFRGVGSPFVETLKKILGAG